MKKVNRGDVKMLVLFVVLAVAVIGLIVFEVFGVGRKKTASSDAVAYSVSQSVPAGEAEEMQGSKTEAYRTPGRRRGATVDEYFGSLAADDGEDISLVSGDGARSNVSPGVGNGGASSNVSPVAAGGHGGSNAAERVFGTPPVEQSAPAATTPPRTSGGNPPSGRRVSGMSVEEKLEYDRRRAEMVRDVMTGAASEESPASAASDAGSTPEAPEPLDFSRSAGDGIISSLDDDFSDASVRYADDVKRPFRCMFVRDEKLRNGQRVTLRLLEEYNADGVRIPANTHLQAICKIQERLTLSVRSFEMNGRIVPLTLEAYDTDGLPGIYCPDASKAAKTAGNDAITAAGTTFGGLVGDLANTVLRTGASIARSANGEVSVSVNSGYEFYLVKDEKR